MKTWRHLQCIAFSFSFGVDGDCPTATKCVIFGVVIDVNCTRIFFRSRDKYGENAMLCRYVVNVKVRISLPDSGEKPICALRKS